MEPGAAKTTAQCEAEMNPGLSTHLPSDLQMCLLKKCDARSYSSHLGTMKERPRESQRHRSYIFEVLNHSQQLLTSELPIRKIHPYSFKTLLLGFLLYLQLCSMLCEMHHLTTSCG